MGSSVRHPSYLSCVVRVLSNSSQPLSMDALISGIERQRPITKGARKAVHRAIKQLFQAVPVSPNRYGWLSRLLNGNMFRHPLTSEEARRGFLLLDELEHAVFFPQFFQTYQPDERKLQIELFDERVVEAEAYIERNTWSLRIGKEFVEWIDSVGGQGRDDLLILVKDATAGQYMLRLQPRESRDENEIQKRNMQLAVLAEEIIADNAQGKKVMSTAELAARLIGNGFFKQPVPPDDLHYVLHHYSELRFQNGVGYALDVEELQRAADDQLFMPGTMFAADEALADEIFAGYHELSQPGEPLADSFAGDAMANFEDDSCPSYEAYLDNFSQSGSMDDPLSHSDYHLLEAELEALIGLEQEFGYLLADQQMRKDQLAERLFIDPQTLWDNGLDLLDDSDEDEPPIWAN